MPIIGAAALVCVSSIVSAQAWDADSGVIALMHTCGNLTPQQAAQMLQVPMKLSLVEGPNESFPGAIDEFFYYPDGSSLMVSFQSGVCEVRQEWPPLEPADRQAQPLSRQERAAASKASPLVDCQTNDAIISTTTKGCQELRGKPLR